MDDLLVVHEHAVGHWVIVADDAVDQFMHEGVGLEPEFVDGEVDDAPEEAAPGLSVWRASQASVASAIPGPAACRRRRGDA